MLSIGIDFGTSNSSVAAYDGQTVRLLPLDHHGRSRKMRSVASSMKRSQSRAADQGEETTAI